MFTLVNFRLSLLAMQSEKNREKCSQIIDRISVCSNVFEQFLMEAFFISSKLIPDVLGFSEMAVSITWDICGCACGVNEVLLQSPSYFRLFISKTH